MIYATSTTGKFSMDILTISFIDNLLLASRISNPTICPSSSTSTVTPSTTSILSSTYDSLNWIYKASAFLSYSILVGHHLHPFFFFTAVITRNPFLSSTYVTLMKPPSGLSIHAFILPSALASIYADLKWQTGPLHFLSCVISSCFLRVLKTLPVSL